jgi:IS5 family transposase
MGDKQLGFSDYELSTAKKQTKREKFLAEMEAEEPWQALIDLIEPHNPKASKKGWRPPYPLTTMLRIHLLQQWYDLSDPAMEDALIEVATMRRFAGIALITDRIPDETTILAFRHLLEQNELGEQIFEAVKAHLKANGMAMKQGTIVDATIIAAPSSTFTRAKPECAGGTRTRSGSGIRRCTRPRKATSGTWHVAAGPRSGRWTLLSTSGGKVAQVRLEQQGQTNRCSRCSSTVRVIGGISST